MECIATAKMKMVDRMFDEFDYASKAFDQYYYCHSSREQHNSFSSPSITSNLHSNIFSI